MIDSMVQASKMAAKWNADMARRQEVERWLAYWRNCPWQYLRDYIGKIAMDPEARELCKYIEHVNLTEWVIDQTSLVFRRPPAITLPTDTAPGIIDRFAALLDECGLYATLREVERLSKLLYDVAVLPNIRDGRLCLDIITPDIAFVMQRPDDPTQAERFYYQVGVSQNSVVPDKVNTYHVWTSQGKFEIQTTTGRIIPGSEVPLPAINYDGQMPIVMFRSYIPLDGFWWDGGNSLVDANQVIDLKRTDQSMGEAYNTPTLVMLGTPPGMALNKGRTFAVNIDRNDMGEAVGDVKYISPDEKLDQLSARIRERLEEVCRSKGLNIDILKGSSATSGYQLALSMYDNIERNIGMREIYRPALSRLLQMILITAVRGLPARYGGLSENLLPRIDFAEITIPPTPLELAQKRLIDRQLGLANTIDWMLEDNPDLTREEALKAFKDRDAETESIDPGSAWPESGNDGLPTQA